MEKPEVEKSNKKKLLFWNNKNLMNLKNIKLLSPERNTKMIMMAHQSPQQQKIMTQLKKKTNQGKMWLRKPTHLLSTQKRISTQTKKREIISIPRNS